MPVRGRVSAQDYREDFEQLVTEILVALDEWTNLPDGPTVDDAREAVMRELIAYRRLFDAGVRPLEGPDYELVRVSRGLLERLLAQDPQPVVLVGFDRHEDGTIDLIFREAQSAG